jgi:hypothetical protein
MQISFATTPPGVELSSHFMSKPDGSASFSGQVCVAVTLQTHITGVLCSDTDHVTEYFKMFRVFLSLYTKNLI